MNDKKGKRKVFIQANCQGGPIQKIFTTLKRLEKRYEMIPIEPVHLWKKEAQEHEEIVAKVKEADVFLHQVVTSNFDYYASDELKRYLKSTATLISFPVLYFTGYHPQAVSIRDNVGVKINPSFASYHDTNILNGYKKGVSPEALQSIYFDENYYSSVSIKNNINKSLAELKNRDKPLTIKLTSAIEASMMSKKLFHTISHPTNELIFLLIDNILKKLGEEALSKEEKTLFPEEMQGENKTPVYKSVQKYFGFDEPVEHMIKYEKCSIKNIIDKYYSFYQSLPFLNEKSGTFFDSLAGFGKAFFLGDEKRVLSFKKLYLNNKKEEIISAAKAGYSYDLIARAATVELMKTDLPESFTLQTEQGDEVIVGTKFWPREIERVCKSEI